MSCSGQCQVMIGSYASGQGPRATVYFIPPLWSCSPLRMAMGFWSEPITSGDEPDWLIRHLPPTFEVSHLTVPPADFQYSVASSVTSKLESMTKRTVEIAVAVQVPSSGVFCSHQAFTVPTQADPVGMQPQSGFTTYPQPMASPQSSTRATHSSWLMGGGSLAKRRWVSSSEMSLAMSLSARSPLKAVIVNGGPLPLSLSM